MTLTTQVTRRAFDAEARAEVRRLLQSNRAREVLERLRDYDARDPEQWIELHGLRAMAQDHLGEFESAIRDWTRALHRTSRFPALRPRVRPCLADTLTRIGEMARAERVVQRGLAEIRAQGGHQTYEPWLMETLARIHMRRGTLTLAGRLFEKVIALVGESPLDPVTWATARINWAHVQIRLGEFGRATKILDATEHAGREIGPHVRAPLILTRVLVGLESGDLDAAEQALAAVNDRLVGDHLRYRLVWLQYDAALRIARGGEAAQALSLVDEALGMARTNLPMDDMVAELLRLRASALLDLDRREEALVAAQEAIRVGRGSDLIDHPEGLRVEARCLAALGRTKEARAALGAAYSRIESTEFVVERRKIVRDMEGLGMIPASSPVRGGAGFDGGDGAAHRIKLRDGRCFITSDHGLMERIRAAAESRLPVLLEGETGTGKELVARLLHELGSGREGPFVVVDCTTLSESLAEAELFGVARGAYTGAASDRPGLVGSADGGTLVFDELPELSLPAQSKLLRLLQEGTYRRLGEARSRQVRVRVIATANQDTDRLLVAGKLKADLFFRLHGYRIRLRPLADRPEDVALLAKDFAMRAGLAGVAPDALRELRLSTWPGNARQLEMLVGVAASNLGAGAWLDRATVTELLREAPSLPVASPERQRLHAALEAHAGNVAATARALGMSRQGLYKALHRLGLL